MKTSPSKCRIDSVMVGELSLVRLGPQVSPLTAKFAMRASSTGVSFGAGTMSSWSEATNKRLEELIESMETDIQNALFEEGAVVSSEETVNTEDKIPEL